MDAITIDITKNNMEGRDTTITILITFILTAFIVTVICSTVEKDLANRALSCMANGNTIQQCQTVLDLLPDRSN